MLSENPSWSEILSQDEEWLPANRVPLPIPKMGRRHAANTIAWLMQRAARIHTSVWTQALWTACAHDGGDWAHDTLEGIVSDLERWEGKEKEWLAKEPLLQALLTQTWQGHDDRPEPRPNHIEEVSF